MKNVAPANQRLPRVRKRRAVAKRSRTLQASAAGLGTVRVTDMEKFNPGSKDQVVKYGFPFSLARMGKFAQMYERYMIHKVNIRCVGLGGSAESGSCIYGVLSGAVDDNVKTTTAINSMRPSKCQHISHTTSVSVSHDIQLSKWRKCDEDDAFALYIYTTDTAKTVFEITYDVTFTSPRPF